MDNKRKLETSDRTVGTFCNCLTVYGSIAITFSDNDTAVGRFLMRKVYYNFLSPASNLILDINRVCWGHITIEKCELRSFKLVETGFFDAYDKLELSFDKLVKSINPLLSQKGIKRFCTTEDAGTFKELLQELKTNAEDTRHHIQKYRIFNHSKRFFQKFMTILTNKTVQFFMRAYECAVKFC